MLRIGRIAFVAGSLVAAAAFGQGELFGQIPQSPPSTVGNPGLFANIAGLCPSTQGALFADDFDFTVPTVVTEVRWWGWAADACTLTAGRSAINGVTSFTVTLYENVSPNVPGDPIAGPFEVSSPAAVVDLDSIPYTTALGIFNFIEFDADVFQYTFTLPTPVTFSGITWVSISAETVSGVGWVWVYQGTGPTIHSESETPGERAFTDGSGNWSNATGTFSLAFAVLGPPLDSDGDGLDDATEIALQSTYTCLDINNPDSDGDGLLDGFEVNILCTNPCEVDTDNDGIPDNEDPASCTLESPSEQALFAQFVADAISLADLPNFSGPNGNAKSARKKVLTSRMNEAASLISQEMYAEALEVLNSVLVRVDGDQSPPDWIIDESQRAFVEELVLITIGLIL